MSKPQPVFHRNGITLAVIDHLVEHPDDTLSWAAYADLLEAAEAPAAAILVARRCGLWRGTREEWEREGPEVVDVVPVRWWVCIDMGVRSRRTSASRTDFFTWHVCRGSFHRFDPDDIPENWTTENSGFHYFPTAEAAQTWLTEIALAYARRVRGETEEVTPC